MSSTQLINASSYDTKNMRFSEPIPGSIPDSKPAINYKRINITTVNSDGSVGDLVMATGKVYSYGISENTNQETGKVNGLVMPLVLHDRGGPTQEQKDFVNCFNGIIDHIRKFILEKKEDLELYELESADLKKLNPLYYKKDKGKVVEGAAPTLYAKLIVSKKQGEKIITVFFDEDSGESVNALDLLGKHCYARAAIKVESIFIGNKVSVQFKLYECQVTLIDFGHKRLLQRPTSDSMVSNETRNTVPMTLSKSAPDDDDDIGSLVGDDDEKKDDDDDDEDVEVPVEETIKTIPKKVIKKVVVKKVVK